MSVQICFGGKPDRESVERRQNVEHAFNEVKREIRDKNVWKPNFLAKYAELYPADQVSKDELTKLYQKHLYKLRRDALKKAEAQAKKADEEAAVISARATAPSNVLNFEEDGAKRVFASFEQADVQLGKYLRPWDFQWSMFVKEFMTGLSMKQDEESKHMWAVTFASWQLVYDYFNNKNPFESFYPWNAMPALQLLNELDEHFGENPIYSTARNDSIEWLTHMMNTWGEQHDRLTTNNEITVFFDNVITAVIEETNDHEAFTYSDLINQS